MRVSSYVVIGIMVVAATVMVSSLGMGHWKSKLLPLILGGIILLLGAIELWREMSAGKKAASTKTQTATSERKESREMLRRYLLAGGWVVGFVVTIYLLGFIIAIPLFTLAYTKLHGTSWWFAVILAVLTLGLMYIISEPLASIPLYRGLLFMHLDLG